MFCEGTLNKISALQNRNEFTNSWSNKYIQPYSMNPNHIRILDPRNTFGHKAAKT